MTYPPEGYRPPINFWMDFVAPFLFGAAIGLFLGH